MKPVSILMTLEMNDKVLFVAKSKQDFLDIYFETLDILKQNGIEGIGDMNSQCINIENGHKMLYFMYGNDLDLTGFTKQMIIDDSGLLALNGVANLSETKH